MKSLKTLVRNDQYIIHMTIDLSSPISFLNWFTKEKLLNVSKKPYFSGETEAIGKFVDHKKHPFLNLRGLKTDLRSPGWEVKGANLLITEKRTKFILVLALQEAKLGSLQDKWQQSEKYQGLTFHCASSHKIGKQIFLTKKQLFVRQGRSKNNYPFCPIQ